jgi:NADPH2:quinone reductase
LRLFIHERAKQEPTSRFTLVTRRPFENRSNVLLTVPVMFYSTIGVPMRAIILRQLGDPKLLKVEDVATPDPKGDEVLVEVRAASINPSDVKNVMGVMHGTTLPRIPGRDFAGVVIRGPANSVGREVWGTGGDIGFTRDGSHAQYILLPLAAITPKPAGLSMEAAGSAGLTFVTAWSAMVVAANISKGETALIIGAAGGVGSAAVQIAKARGGRVIGGVRSDEEFAVVRAMGVEEVIKTGSVNIADAVRSLTAGRGADVVFDSSGMMFAEAVDAAAANGRIAVISSPRDGKATFDLRSLYRKELRILGVDTRQLDAVACAKLLSEMLPFFKSGAFNVKAGESRPLAQAAEAYEQAAQGAARVVLQPNK